MINKKTKNTNPKTQKKTKNPQEQKQRTKTNQESSNTKTRKKKKGKRGTEKGGGLLWCPVSYVWELDLHNSNQE